MKKENIISLLASNLMRKRWADITLFNSVLNSKFIKSSFFIHQQIRKKMTIEEAKSIRIADYLHSLGYSPVKQQGINLWYKSPFREESEASFKVNTEREQWYDFGLGKGGNIIALAAHLYATDHVPYILKRIAEQTPHVRPVSFSFGKQSSSEPSFQQLEIVPLSSPALLAYLQGRGINIELAKRECSEARFTHNGKRYFAIAFPNGSGGFEVRNRYFKGCIAPKEISHIR